MPKTPEQRERWNARRRELFATDPLYRERIREQGRIQAAKYRARNPQGYSATKARTVRKNKGDGLPRIYFVQAASGPIKIGFTTKTPESRLSELQVGSFEELTLMGAMPGSQRQELEIHRRFEHLRIRGEWFRASPELSLFITTALSEGTCRSATSPRS